MHLIDRLLGGFDDARERVIGGGDRMIGRGWRARDRARTRIGGEDRPNPWLMAALGAAGGALAAYLLDPVRGRSRRARYGDQAAALVRRGVGRAGRGARMVGSTVEGKLEAVRHRGDGQSDLNDPALADKVETELFRDPSVPKGKINVNVEQGRVVLRGEVDSDDQRRQLEKQASRIPGVWSVENLLHLPGEPAPEERVRTTG